MKYPAMVNTLLAALLSLAATTAIASDAPAAVHKAAPAPASAANHGPAAIKEDTTHASKTPETLQPSIHPLRKQVAHAAAPVRTSSHAPAHGSNKTASHKTRPHKPAAVHRSHAAHDDHDHGGEVGKVQNLVKAMLAANSNYMKRNNSAYFDKFASKQTPRAMVVTCADSRVQSNAFHGDAVNDLFMVRNIGNQLATSEGSVEYGVRHLNTPLLMFVGHAVCGAVAAASGDFSKLERPIQKELLTINIPKGINVNEGALMNVNNQVDAAMLKFGGEVESGKLAVIGAFYDFRNDFKQGKGKLIITNINGETDPAKLAALTKAGNFFNAATGMSAAPAAGH
ncbi:MAG: carbonic anhydrase [Vogesella sp.]|uniref:carbonic anhydrase n=1 Tax=Vogesella sp. TaxID=1904252 RepID=UPI0039189AEE